MSRRQKAAVEGKPGPAEGHTEQEEVQEAPPETRRTRSGRAVRTPAALLDSEAPVRTPSRRTRRSVLQELPAVEERNTEDSEPKAESLPEETPDLPAERELCTMTEADSRTDLTGIGNGDQLSSETVPQKKPRLAPSETQHPAIPLGKPKSGRVWKERNKQR